MHSSRSVPGSVPFIVHNCWTGLFTTI